MKEIIAHILIIVICGGAIMIGLSAILALIWTAGDKQRKKDKNHYDRMYELIHSQITDRKVNDVNYTFIENCIDVLGTLPYKNREMTDALYRQLDRRFKADEIKELKEAIYEV